MTWAKVQIVFPYSVLGDLSARSQKVRMKNTAKKTSRAKVGQRPQSDPPLTQAQKIHLVTEQGTKLLSGFAARARRSMLRVCVKIGYAFLCSLTVPLRHRGSNAFGEQ